MRNRTTVVLCLIAILAAPQLHARQAVAAPEERALAAIQADRIMADLRFVACDDTGGRDTPSVGERLVARFLQNRLQRLGWQPGAKQGWLATYPLTRRVLDESACQASVQQGERTVPLALADDYSFPPLEIEDVELKGEVVFLGKPPSEIDASAAAMLAGHWALFTEKGGDLNALDAGLRKAGAIGVLTTIDVVNTGGDPQARVVFKLFADMMRAGCVSWPNPHPTLPRVYLPRKTIEKLLSLAGGGHPTAPSILPIQFSETRRMATDETLQAENVVGFWPGADPDLQKQVVIVSAHYDHIGIGAKGVVYPGADDNGSGVCALLALAEALAAHGPLECSVLLVWTSGEEKGLWGSLAFVESAWFPDGAKPAANINLDMVGRNAGQKLSLTPFEDQHPASSALARLARETAPQEGFSEVTSGDAYFHRSDNFNFAKLGIPVISFYDDMSDDYHQPGDRPDKVDGDKIRRVTRLVLRLLLALQEDPAERAR